jgi:hypothetical protein
MDQKQIRSISEFIRDLVDKCFDKIQFMPPRNSYSIQSTQKIENKCSLVKKENCIGKVDHLVIFSQWPKIILAWAHS